MKPGDIVQLVDTPQTDWMEEYAGRLFEVREVYERRCLVRMLNVVNQERYWFRWRGTSYSSARHLLVHLVWRLRGGDL